jgi:hypothetical protein
MKTEKEIRKSTYKRNPIIIKKMERRIRNLNKFLNNPANDDTIKLLALTNTTKNSKRMTRQLIQAYLWLGERYGLEKALRWVLDD